MRALLCTVPPKKTGGIPRDDTGDAGALLETKWEYEEPGAGLAAGGGGTKADKLALRSA